MRYISKPQTVEAIQWDDTDAAVEALWEHTGGKVLVRFDPFGRRVMHLEAGVNGAQEFVPVPTGHWVVRKPGDPSDVWPVDPVHFADKYQAAGA